MPTGTITELTHLSAQTHLQNAQLVPQHNETGFGHLEGEDGTVLYFEHGAVEGCEFTEMFEGQQVEYSVDDGSKSRAKRVAPLHDDPQPGRSGVKNPP